MKRHFKFKTRVKRWLKRPLRINQKRLVPTNTVEGA